MTISSIVKKMNLTRKSNFYVTILFRMRTCTELKKISFEPLREKTGFCICENNGADQLSGNREADQRLCFRYMDSTIHLLP